MSASSYTPGGFKNHQQVELEAHIEVIKSYWNRCLLKSNQCVGDASEISSYVSLISKLLLNDKFITQLDEGTKTHPLFEMAVEMDLFYHLYKILGRFRGEQLESLKEACLHFYDLLLSCHFYELFLRKEFLVPMMCTLNLCSHHSSLRIENLLLQTLHDICVALHQQAQYSVSDDSKLKTESNDLFWSICLNPYAFLQTLRTDIFADRPQISMELSERSPSEIRSICDLLVNYVHREGSLCWLSRDSLLLLVTSSTTNENAGYYMANNSTLCEVLVTDMVLFFNKAPRQLVDCKSADDWPFLIAKLDEQIVKDHSLHKFLDHYEFCCSILDMSNYRVKENMLICLYKGFLLPVLVAALQSEFEPELATATLYLDRILWKSKGSILLPFLLRFLFSERISSNSDSVIPQSFRYSITQALQQSFPLNEASFYCRTNELPSAAHAKTYMDVLLNRIQYSNTLVGIATLSLMNTIVDLLCEDVAFELVFKYLLPLGTQPILNKAVVNPSVFLESAGQYLALIPPYSSVPKGCTNKSLSDLDGSRWHNSQKGDLSFNEGGTEEPGSGGEATEFQGLERMHSCLQEARKLIAERKSACGDWRFPYDLGSPSPSMALGAHMNENVLAPLPQEGLKVPQNLSEVSVAANRARLLSIGDRIQWELDGSNQMCEEDCILADLERFSAILREPSCQTYKCEPVPIPSFAAQHQRHYGVVPDPEEVKRTSSLYDITFLEMDSDEVTDSAETNVAPHSVVKIPERMSQSLLVRRVSMSPISSNKYKAVEPNSTLSPEHLPEGVGEIAEGNVLDLMRYLDRIPSGDCNDGESVETIFADCMHRFIGPWERRKTGNPENQVDSGFDSVDSELMKNSSIVGNSSTDSRSLYPGPFFTSLLQLISQMPINHLYANLQATRLITHLLALPLPLMRLQLLPLRSQTAAGFNNQGLYATLMAVRQWFDCFINLNFSSLLKSVPENEDSFASLIEAIRRSVFQFPKRSFAQSRVHYAPTKELPNRIPWLLSRLRLSPHSTFVPTLVAPKKSPTPSADIDETASCDWRAKVAEGLKGGSFADLLKAVKDAKSRDVLVALFVFEEFCRELAALCLEHSVIL